MTTETAPETSREPAKKRINVDAWNRAFSVVSYVVMGIVTTGVGWLSWGGLTNFGTKVLKLGNTAYVVPLALDGMAVMFLFMAVISVAANHPAMVPQFMVNLYALGSGAFNGYHAWVQYDRNLWTVAFYSGVSLSLAVAFHWLLGRIKRGVLEDVGAIERPLARFRPARWVRYPRTTFLAWSVALDQGITDPTEALDIVRTQRMDRYNHAVQPVRWWHRNSPNGGGSGGSPIPVQSKESSPVQSIGSSTALPGSRPALESSPVQSSPVPAASAVQSGPGVQFDGESSPVQSGPAEGPVQSDPVAGPESSPVESSPVQPESVQVSPVEVQSSAAPVSRPVVRESAPARPVQRLSMVQSGPALVTVDGTDPTGLSKFDRVVWALAQGVQPDAKTVQNYLMEHGAPVGRSTVFEALKAIQSNQSSTALRAVQ